MIPLDKAFVIVFVILEPSAFAITLAICDLAVLVANLDIHFKTRAGK
jgi:hypothetical protein